MQSTNLEQYIHQNIPISKAMGVRQIKASPNQVILQGCYSSNINHKNTVFGGSLQTLCVLSCWSIIHLNVQDVPGQFEIVIRECNTQYLRPIKTDFQSASELDLESAQWVKFLQKLNRKGRAKITTSAIITQDDQPAVKFVGTFACIRQD